MKRRVTYQSTRPTHYFEPRYSPMEWKRHTWLERHGELIATSIGLAAMAFALGLVIWAAIVLP